MNIKKQIIVGCLSDAIKATGMSKSEAARYLNVNESNFCRTIRSPKHTKFETLESYLIELSSLAAQMKHVANDRTKIESTIKNLWRA